MATVSEGNSSIEFVLSKKAHQSIKDLAQELSSTDEKVFVADIVRDALAEYFTKYGREIDFGITRGGYWKNRLSKP